MAVSIEEHVRKLIETTVSVEVEKYYHELLIQNKQFLNKKEVCI